MTEERATVTVIRRDGREVRVPAHVVVDEELVLGSKTKRRPFRLVPDCDDGLVELVDGRWMET